jgi:hypothetical protein
MFDDDIEYPVGELISLFRRDPKSSSGSKLRVDFLWDMQRKEKPKNTINTKKGMLNNTWTESTAERRKKDQIQKSCSNYTNTQEI